MILLPRDVMEIAAKAVNRKVYEWASNPKISEDQWDALYDVVSANLDRLQWIFQMTTEDLLNRKISDVDLPNRLYFKVLQNDFEWDWSCDLDPKTYWPSGLSYGTEKILKDV